MTREQAIEIARKHAKAKPQGYYAEPFQPHEWVIDAIIEASTEAEFKNFHRLLCERFGYGHDEVNWQRDQLSLIEHIASQASGGVKP